MAPPLASAAPPLVVLASIASVVCWPTSWLLSNHHGCFLRLSCLLLAYVTHSDCRISNYLSPTCSTASLSIVSHDVRHHLRSPSPWHRKRKKKALQYSFFPIFIAQLTIIVEMVVEHNILGDSCLRWLVSRTPVLCCGKLTIHHSVVERWPPPSATIAHTCWFHHPSVLYWSNKVLPSTWITSLLDVVQKWVSKK